MALTYGPSQLEKGSRAVFMRQFLASSSPLVQSICMRVDSLADNETYAWLGDAPQMVELKDEVNYFSMSDTDYTITNVEYAAGVAFRHKDLINDQTGGMTLRIMQLATVAAMHAEKLLIAAMVAGTTATGYDGYAFFGNSHPARGQQTSTQDNLLAGSGTSTANMATDVNTGLSELANFVSENGEPHNQIMSTIAVVAPPALRKAALEAITATIVSSTENVQTKGMKWELHFNARLTAEDVNDWYMADVSEPIKPFVYQVREPVKFAEQKDGDDAFDKHIYKYKTTAYHAVGYGLWQKAVKFVNT